MRMKTFFKIYYKHRIDKSNIFKKIYIIVLLPINYLLNLIFLEKRRNLDEEALQNRDLFQKSLSYLFENFNSDKGDKFFNQYQKPIKKEKNLIDGHQYNLFYEKFLNSKKYNVNTILELGTFKGNATASFFYFFPNAVIDTGDLYPDLLRYKSNRINNFKIDTSSKKEIHEKLISQKKNYELIIEDAGHYYKDQIISLFMLFPKLNKGGIFIIEELDFPDTRDDMNILKEKPTLKDILKLVNENKEFTSDHIDQSEKKYFLENFKSINIFKGRFNEIAFIEKK